ncbi:MAG TPA: hypothetical protein PLC52_10205 [Anaerolineales bacterium]|nr:hypothetical protein [Anaerolineales bacterium]HRQ93223.1 hypothetical protein [Anaerolineales bacterium]
MTNVPEAKAHLSLFGKEARWHLVRLIPIVSLPLAFIVRLWREGDIWVDLFPIGIIATLLAFCIKPFLFSKLDDLLEKQRRFGPKWFALIGGTTVLATLLSMLATFSISRLSFSKDLPLSIWAIDGLLGLLLVSLMYAFTSRDEVDKKSNKLHWLAFTIFLLAGLGMVWKALDYPMTYDDLHLIRHFNATDLSEAWSGNWEPDNIETPGYRPLSTAFYHFRFVLFEESVATHRIFMVVLYAGFLTQIVMLAERFQLPFLFAILGGLLTLAARQSIFHYVWLTDGIHLLQGLLLIQAVIFIIRGIDTRQTAYFAYALFVGTAALLVREDNLILIPLAWLFTFAYLRILKSPVVVQIAAYALCVCLSFAGGLYYLARGYWIDSAAPIGFNTEELLELIDYTVYGFTGRQAFDSISSFFVSTWPLMLIVCGLLLFKLLCGDSKKEAGFRALTWLGAAAASCLIGLVNARANLTFFSLMFFSMALATVLAEYATRSYVWRASLAALSAIALIGLVYISQTAIEGFHPSSSLVVYWNSRFVYGKYSAATIPQERLDATIARLGALGIDETNYPSDYSVYLGQDATDNFSMLMKQSLSEGERRPSQNSSFFVPLLAPFSP